MITSLSLGIQIHILIKLLIHIINDKVIILHSCSFFLNSYFYVGSFSRSSCFLGSYGSVTIRNSLAATIVWHGKIIRRYSFVFRLAIRGRLYTQDRLVAIGLVQGMKCVLFEIGRISTMSLFAALSHTVFDLIFDIEAIFTGLVRTERSLFGG
jgi:hypothetical protein